MMRTLPQILIALIIAATMLCACEDDKKEVISGKADPETTPTMTTTDVSTLISDSGITRYKITTPLWLVFDEARDPRWTFPNSLHLEKFDPAFKPEATIDCDSAIFFKDRQLWRLDGYVNIRNTLGEKFLTNQLFWNQREQKIYSDSFIHIEKEGKIIEGYGFESNEQMTRYNVIRVAAIFPASQFKPDTARISARNAVDSASHPAPAPATAPPAPDRTQPAPPKAKDPAMLNRRPLRQPDGVKNAQLEKIQLEKPSNIRRPGVEKKK